MTGKTLRGAFVAYSEGLILPSPTVVVFQFNPETITHGWTGTEVGGDQNNPLAMKSVPAETFNFTLILSATEMIADGGPVAEASATAFGVHARLAALETLLLPVKKDAGSSLLGGLSALASNLTGGLLGSAAPTPTTVPNLTAKMILFIWGPNRVLPVRLTSLTVTEKLFDAALNPVEAEAGVGLKVLTESELKSVDGVMGKLATAAFSLQSFRREALNLANLGDSAESIIGMLPIG